MSSEGLQQEGPAKLILTVLLVTVFGGIAIISQNSHFIKMKPTVAYAFFALILLFGLIRQKLYLKSVLSEKISISDYAWGVLTKRLILFFLVIAAANEVIWRIYSEETWIYFKTFGIFPLTIAFIMAQIPLISKHKL